MTDQERRKRKFSAIIIAYPLAMFLVGAALNWFAFGINPAVISLPSHEIHFAWVVAGVFLVINHTWLMTSTELTRLKHDIRTTPEEWDAAGTLEEEITKKGWRELARRHNAHRNVTENTVHFVFSALVLGFTSPTPAAAQVWIIGFAVARLGYTYAYLSGRDDVRGIFMSLSLVALYGIASYLVIGLWI